MFKVCAYISHRRLDGLLYTSLLREVMLILQHHFSRQKQMLSSETRYVISLSSLLHSFSSLSVLFTCLHLISIKNGLTPLEVAIVKRDEWKEETEKRQRQRLHYWYKNRDYEGVIDVLSRYSKEPATLPSHDVSRFNTRNNHVAFTILPHIVQDTPSLEQDTTPTHLSSTVDKDTLSSTTNSQVSSVLCKRFIHYLHYYY